MFSKPATTSCLLIRESRLRFYTPSPCNVPNINYLYITRIDSPPFLIPNYVLFFLQRRRNNSDHAVQNLFIAAESSVLSK